MFGVRVLGLIGSGLTYRRWGLGSRALDKKEMKAEMKTAFFRVIQRDYVM